MKTIKTEPGNDSLRERVLAGLQGRLAVLQAQKTPANCEPPRYSGPLFSASFQSELQWLAGDFKTERQWKREQTRKIGRELVKFMATRETQETKLRKIASTLAKEVDRYWRSVGEVVKHRRHKRKAQKVKEEKSRKLEYLVNKTELFMGKVVNAMLGHSRSSPLSDEPISEEPDDLISEEPEEATSAKDGISEESGEESGDSASSEMVGSEMEDSESSLDEAEADDADLETRERAEAADLLADADRPIEEILAEMQQASSDHESSSASPDSASDIGSQSQSSESSESIESEISEELLELEASKPSGTTLTSSTVTIPVPALLRGTMRDYQHIGLQWLAALGDRIPGKILADEPGLGKTLQSIALLAHLACAEGIWGPHLIIVPTSVLLNWEIEFKKFCPGMKVLVYFGSAKERAQLRIGWNKANAFHAVITSYSIVLQDAHIFKRKRWYYMILDEAHNIKNFKSQRWQTLLTFNTERRLLLTGTPLSNDISDLWALLHFLVPDVFESHTEFREWFGNPLKAAAEKQQLHMYQELIGRLQAMLRPFLLRRLKRDVEKQMPSKYEHVIKCQLSKRQRILYDEFIGLKETRGQLANGSYLGMMNVLMQLRKVCNHPDLFAERPVKSPLVLTQSLTFELPVGGVGQREEGGMTEKRSLLKRLAFVHGALRDAVSESLRLRTTAEGIVGNVGVPDFKTAAQIMFELERVQAPAPPTFGEYVQREHVALLAEMQKERDRRRFESLRMSIREVEKDDHIVLSRRQVELATDLGGRFVEVMRPRDAPPLVLSIAEQARKAKLDDMYFFQWRATARTPALRCTDDTVEVADETAMRAVRQMPWANQAAMVSSNLLLPDKRFLEWDCGKLKMLNSLLRRLYNEGHKCIIFTQMSKMLDILEAWINTQSYNYVRMDGGTKVEMRQALIDKFNGDPKVFLFISSTRAGGLGITLTAADCVIFYDSDWSAAMDKQAIDRAHRISQTRDVHVYRLISEFTVEENIFRKQLQKRAIDEAVIDGGRFDESSIEKWTAGDVKQILEMDGADVGDIYGTQTLFKQLDGEEKTSARAVEAAMAQVEDEEDVKAMQGAMKEAGAAPDLDDFVSKEERAFNALPAIVKAGVRFMEETREDGDEDEEDHDEDGVEVFMEGWESDADGDAEEPKKKKPKVV